MTENTRRGHQYDKACRIFDRRIGPHQIAQTLEGQYQSGYAAGLKAAAKANEGVVRTYSANDQGLSPLQV